MAPKEPVPAQNLFLALTHVVEILNRRQILYAVTGGLAMILHGYGERTADDIDIVVEATLWDEIWPFFQTDAALINRKTVMRAERSGGPPLLVLLDLGLGTTIKVELVRAGQPKGTPDWQLLRSTTTTATYVEPGKGERSVQILNIQAMFDANIEAVNDGQNRMEGDYKDIPDLIWFCENRQEDIQGFTGQLRATKINALDAFSEAIGSEYWGVDLERQEAIGNLLGQGDC